MGFVVSLISSVLALWALGTSLLLNQALPGWTSTVVPMYFLGGIQLLSIGVIGEYIAKLYMESKSRPRFHIDKLNGCAFSINGLRYTDAESKKSSLLSKSDESKHQND